jgi:hypothetical protein
MKEKLEEIFKERMEEFSKEAKDDGLVYNLWHDYLRDNSIEFAVATFPWADKIYIKNCYFNKNDEFLAIPIELAKKIVALGYLP